MANQYLINTNTPKKQLISFNDGTYATFEVLQFIGNSQNKKEILIEKTNNPFLSAVVENGNSIKVNLQRGYDLLSFEDKVLIFKDFN